MAKEEVSTMPAGQLIGGRFQSASRSRSAVRSTDESSTSASPKKWALFPRGKDSSPSKKQISLFQSRRRRQQKKEIRCKDSISKEPTVGVPRRAAKKSTSQRTSTTKEEKSGVTQQSVTLQIPSYSPTERLDDHQDEQYLLRDDRNTNTTLEPPQLFPSVETVVELADVGRQPLPLDPKAEKLPNSETVKGRFLIFDREKKSPLSVDDIPSDENVHGHSVKIFGQTLGKAGVLAVICGLLAYLAQKTIKKAKSTVVVYKLVSAKLHQIGHLLCMTFTALAWLGTIIAWSYAARSCWTLIQAYSCEQESVSITVIETGSTEKKEGQEKQQQPPYNKPIQDPVLSLCTTKNGTDDIKGTSKSIC